MSIITANYTYSFFYCTQDDYNLVDESDSEYEFRLLSERDFDSVEEIQNFKE